jgi:hypothetical protein
MTPTSDIWHSEQEIVRDLGQSKDLDRLSTAFALSLFLQRAVYPQGYKADSRWAEVIKPSRAGIEYLSLDSEASRGVEQADALLALFGQFFYQEILIDLEHSDFTQARLIANAEMLSHKIR